MRYRVGYIADERFLEHNPGSGHPERPERLRAIYSAIESYRHRAELVHVEPRSATEDDIKLVHTAAHLERMRKTSGKRVVIDSDTITSARSYEVALLAAGAILEGVDQILAGKLDRAFAFIRPPGHHAEPDRAMGFCLFNNVAIGAAYAISKHGLDKVLIIDYDLHHGNGTQDAFYDSKRVLYISTHQYPYYPGTGGFSEIGRGEGRGYTINLPLAAGADDGVYYRIFRGIIRPICLQYRPELVLVSAGFDPYFDDPLGGMLVSERGFAAMSQVIVDIANECCKGRALFALEGGYNLKGLQDSSLAVMDVLLEKGEADAEVEPSYGLEPIFEKARRHFGEFWKF